MYQIHYDPTSTPVASVVTKFISGAVNESDPQPPNTLRGGEDNPIIGVEHLRDKPFKYLKIDTGRVLVMSREERDAVDAFEVAQREAQEDADLIENRWDPERMQRAIVQTLIAKGVTTKAELVLAYKQTR